MSKSIAPDGGHEKVRMGRKTWWREQSRPEEEMVGFPAPSILFSQSPSAVASLGVSQGKTAASP